MSESQKALELLIRAQQRHGLPLQKHYALFRASATFMMNIIQSFKEVAKDRDDVLLFSVMQMFMLHGVPLVMDTRIPEGEVALLVHRRDLRGGGSYVYPSYSEEESDFIPFDDEDYYLVGGIR